MINRRVIKDLIIWKDDSLRKPLILRGARQVGKTTVVNEFSKEFDVFLKLNLELEVDRNLFESYNDVHELIEAIHLHCKKKVGGGTCLLFIDEIQFSAAAVAILRYFYEEVSNVHVIAAGSLLESLMETKKISFPVGRVEYLMLRPFSFFEFLEGIGETFDLETLSNFKADLIHDRMMKHFHRFTLVGGMPAAVVRYGLKRDLLSTNKIFESLLESYKDDIEKYASNDTTGKVIRHLVSTFWGYAGEQITFENFGASKFKSREMSIAFKIIEKAMLVELVYPTFETKFPLLADYRKKPKLICLDAGLVNFMAKMQEEVFMSQDIQDVWRGKIAEQIVAQELISNNYSVSETRHFWRRNKLGSEAEVDFVFPYKGRVIPIEVKSGQIGKLKSLHLFMDECPHDLAVRVWSKSFSIDLVKTPKGKEFKLINVPFYYVSVLKEFLDLIALDLQK
jgi:predicted AAA+ superfamily ATPase